MLAGSTGDRDAEERTAKASPDAGCSPVAEPPQLAGRLEAGKRSQAAGDVPHVPAADRAVRVILPESSAEVAGAVLMDFLGPFQTEILRAAEGAAGIAAAGDIVTGDIAAGDIVIGDIAAGSGTSADPVEPLAALVFFPAADLELTPKDVLAALPTALSESGQVRVETLEVPRDWVEGWRDHFHPITVGEVRIRPPWEAPLSGATSGGAAAGIGTAAATGTAAGIGTAAATGGARVEGAAPAAGAAPGAGGAGVDTGTVAASGALAALHEVVINPGLGFGTGLHPTTRGVLQLLQVPHPGGARGPLVDVGTGSGILAIAAAKLGWGPIFAFDNDPIALISARENVEANQVADIVEVHETDVSGVAAECFVQATVLANMTLEPVAMLVRKLRGVPLLRLVVSGILEGAQEHELLSVVRECGLSSARRLYEGEWVSMELLPAAGS